MTMFMVVSWAAYALSSKRPIWAFHRGRGSRARLVHESSAAFFGGRHCFDNGESRSWTPASRRAALWTHGRRRRCPPRSIAVVRLAALARIWFYNVRMSMKRKPTYDQLHSFNERASWYGGRSGHLYPSVAIAGGRCAQRIAGIWARQQSGAAQSGCSCGGC
jgi:hypothetical protein